MLADDDDMTPHMYTSRFLRMYAAERCRMCYYYVFIHHACVWDACAVIYVLICFRKLCTMWLQNILLDMCSTNRITKHIYYLSSI